LVSAIAKLQSRRNSGNENGLWKKMAPREKGGTGGGGDVSGNDQQLVGKVEGSKKSRAQGSEREGCKQKNKSTIGKEGRGR